MLRPFPALALALTAGAAFAAVAIWVGVGDPSGFDQAGVACLQAPGGPTLDRVMATWTFVGSVWISTPAIAITAAWALRQRARSLAIVVAATGIATAVLDPLSKVLFHRARPDGFAKVTLPGSYSFPSGHAIAAVAIYGIIAVAIVRLRPSLRWPVTIALPLWALALGGSRVYLGVHWPTDVLAGFALGAMILVGGIAALDRTSRRTSELARGHRLG